MKKRKLSLLLVLVMLLGMLPTAVLAAEDEAPHGSCGENVTWSYDAESKTLTISGSGPMADYTVQNRAPWNDKEITKVVVEDGVTTVGAFAFYYKNTITAIELPTSVTSIGQAAFYMTAITDTKFLPETVTSVGGMAFFGCTALKEAVWPASCKTVPMGAFYGCSNLERITLPNGVEELASSAFQGLTKVQQLELPASITKIQSNACGGWTADQKIIFPSGYSQETIDSFPSGWKGSAQVVVLTVTYSGNCGATGNDENVTWAYYEAAGLLEISGTGAMADYGQNKAPWHKQSWTNDIKSIVVNDRVTSIGNNAFMKLTGVTADKIRIADTVETIGTGAFANNNITNIDFLPDGLKVVSKQSFYGCKSLTTIVLPSKCVEVGNSAFFGLRNAAFSDDGNDLRF